MVGSKIRARLAAATPGPWRVHDYDHSSVQAGDTIVAEATCGMGRAWEEDAALIANAPSDLAELLEVAEAAERLLVALEPALSEAPIEMPGPWIIHAISKARDEGREAPAKGGTT